MSSKLKSKIRVFMTGATGVMGQKGMNEILRYPEEYSLTILARDSKKNHKLLKPYIKKGVKIIWGDLLDKKSLRNGIKDSDIVLHVGGLVSPEADINPEKTMLVNTGSMSNIIEIVREFEEAEPDRVIKTVYIGSVSQYGPSMPPNHTGQVGKKLNLARLDAYALSKILAERILAESKLKKWVSLRQTGILHAGLLKKADDPIMFHVPLNGVLEWISADDSGNLLERICRPEVPEKFWNNFYNVGGGQTYRMTNLEFEKKLLKAMGCPPPKKIFEPQWFATDNFHGLWFTDSDALDDILHYRSGETFDQYMNRMKSELPFYFKLAPIVPAFIIKRFMKKVAKKKPLGPLSWIETNDQKRIRIAWGDLENQKNIKSWGEFEKNSEKLMNSVLVKSITAEDLLSTNQNLDRQLKTVKCQRNHKYLSSDWLYTHGGHGCPECLKLQSELNYGSGTK